jgi:hypothetical protein
MKPRQPSPSFNSNHTGVSSAPPVRPFTQPLSSGFHLSVWQDHARKRPPWCSLTLTPPFPRGLTSVGIFQT